MKRKDKEGKEPLSPPTLKGTGTATEPRKGRANQGPEDRRIKKMDLSKKGERVIEQSKKANVGGGGTGAKHRKK